MFLKSAKVNFHLQPILKKTNIFNLKGASIFPTHIYCLSASLRCAFAYGGEKWAKKQTRQLIFSNVEWVRAQEQGHEFVP
jgi:hypothetical protein